MKDFVAIDFETANNERSSVCSVGIVIVRNGEIVDNFYSLIQPEPNYYNYWCSQEKLWLRAANMFVVASILLIIIGIGAILFGIIRNRRK